MEKINIFEVLSRVLLFENLTERQIRNIADIARVKEVSKREHIFLSGDGGDHFYILSTGAVQLYNISKDGREIVVKVVKSGELFGEVILFESESYPVSAVALKPSLLFAIPRDKFLILLDDAAFRSSFIGQIMKKLRFLTNQIHYLSDYDVEDRLILFFHERYGCCKKFTVDIAKKDIAAAIGTTSETLSRTIGRLQREDLLEWKGKVVSLSDALCSIKCEALGSKCGH